MCERERRKENAGFPVDFRFLLEQGLGVNGVDDLHSFLLNV